MNERKERLEKVNELTRFIGTHGRRFFFSSISMHGTKDHFAHMVKDERGRLWWVDHYTEDRVYLHYPHWSHRQGFTSGGTLRSLVKSFKEYVMTGKQIKRMLGPFPDWLNGSDPWGYGGDMDLVRQKAIELGIAEESVFAMENNHV